MNPIESAALSLAFPLLAAALCAAVTAGALALRKYTVQHPKLLPLTDVIDIAGQALEAGIKAAGASGPTPASIKAAETATFNVVAAHKGELEADAANELRALCSHAVALKAGGELVTTRVGVSIVMPTPVKVGA